MKVSLIHHTPLAIAIQAIRTCHESYGLGDSTYYDSGEGWIYGPKDLALITKVGNKMKHSSTLEHLTYNFWIEGISRALLQELARHRIASLSVKSTRYTLKELEKERSFENNKEGYPIQYDMDRVAKFCVLTGNSQIDFSIAAALENTRRLKAQKIPNDVAKFALPDAYKTKLTWSINARSLQNFLSLRTPPSAMWEIRKLAKEVYKALPEDHKYIFVNSIYKEGES